MTIDELAAKGLRVKPLVWDDSIKGRWIGQPSDALGGLAFWVFQQQNEYFRPVAGAGRVFYPTLASAQAAAEADHATRAAAQIEVQP
jgi:hypothetical protein